MCVNDRKSWDYAFMQGIHGMMLCVLFVWRFSVCEAQCEWMESRMYEWVLGYLIIASGWR
jgi:hypothetical protein